jgi:hypothetical protein
MRPSNVDVRGEIHAPDQKRTRPSPSAAAGYKKQKRDAEMLTHLFERRLNDAVVQDIFRVTHSHPTILKCSNQFNSLILCRPFKVHLASFAAGKLTETAEFQRHIAKFWMPWVPKVTFVGCSRSANNPQRCGRYSCGAKCMALFRGVL